MSNSKNQTHFGDGRQFEVVLEVPHFLENLSLTPVLLEKLPLRRLLHLHIKIRIGGTGGEERSDSAFACGRGESCINDPILNLYHFFLFLQNFVSLCVIGVSTSLRLLPLFHQRTGFISSSERLPVSNESFVLLLDRRHLVVGVEVAGGLGEQQLRGDPLRIWLVLLVLVQRLLRLLFLVLVCKVVL